MQQSPATALSERDRALHVGYPSSVTDTEEGRAFLQKRLSIFGLCLFTLAGTSWAVLAVAYFVLSAQGLEHSGPFSKSGLLHLADALLPGALWLATRTGRRSGRLLHVLDVAVTLALIAVWALLGTAMPDAKSGSSIALLAFITGTLARAIVVPSKAKRTLLIGLIGGAVLIGIAVSRSLVDRTALVSVIPTTCWVASAVTLATIASHTIFGLRREVQQKRVLGQYTLESKIAEGGMGVVWRANHALLRRPTAIKLLAPHRAGDQAIRRFEREVQLTSRLTHPNSVAIYDYGRTRDGIFYYAMEFLEGTDLDQLVADHGPQPPGRVVHVLTQVCGALAEAHDLGLVHRDVKPANVLLSPRKNEHEVAKIVDFGLVKSVELDARNSAVSAINTITGTPLYMAPEAIQAPESVDGRSDLYALGAVAWFLLVGRPPFEGESVVEVCARHLHETPERPSIALGSPIPSDLEDIVLACLEKPPSSRPADARTLRDLLEGCKVDAWTPAHAADFWNRASAHGHGFPSLTPRTIDLDVSGRAPDTLEMQETPFDDAKVSGRQAAVPSSR
jgi:eukaryotic-like serine/threonine-protein kinase